MRVIIILFLLIFIYCNKSVDPNVNDITKITETNGIGDLNGDIDYDDWSSEEYVKHGKLFSNADASTYIGKNIIVKPLVKCTRDAIKISVLNFSDSILHISAEIDTFFKCDTSEYSIQPYSTIFIEVICTLHDSIHVKGELIISSLLNDYVIVQLSNYYYNIIIPYTSDHCLAFPPFPNPASDYIMFRFVDGMYGLDTASVYIFNEKDIKVKTLFENVTSPHYPIHLLWDLTDDSNQKLAPGFYRAIVYFKEWGVNTTLSQILGDIKIEN